MLLLGGGGGGGGGVVVLHQSVCKYKAFLRSGVKAESFIESH